MLFGQLIIPALSDHFIYKYAINIVNHDAIPGLIYDRTLTLENGELK